MDARGFYVGEYDEGDSLVCLQNEASNLAATAKLLTDLIEGTESVESIDLFGIASAYEVLGAACERIAENLQQAIK